MISSKENHGAPVEELLEEVPPELSKVIALKEVKFSNSPIEAVNKIAKRYLRCYDPRTLAKLKGLIPWIIADYKEVRSHDSLKGLAPMENYKAPTKRLEWS